MDTMEKQLSKIILQPGILHDKTMNKLSLVYLLKNKRPIGSLSPLPKAPFLPFYGFKIPSKGSIIVEPLPGQLNCVYFYRAGNDYIELVNEYRKQCEENLLFCL